MNKHKHKQAKANDNSHSRDDRIGLVMLRLITNLHTTLKKAGQDITQTNKFLNGKE